LETFPRRNLVVRNLRAFFYVSYVIAI